MPITLAFRAAGVDDREAFSAKTISSCISDASQLNVCWVDGLATVALNARLSLCQRAAHYRYLQLVRYLRPRRVDVLAALLGVMGEDLLVADALASGQVNIAGSTANPRLR
jgi:hypothetical protein